MSIVSDLERILGPDRVSTSEPVLLSYAYNAIFGKEVARKPDIVVMPRTTEEVSAVIKAANEHRVPVTPKGIVGATGHGGTAEGGILLDLTLMDKIVKIDPVNMKAVTEGGCSFFKLSHELFKVGLMLPTAPYGPGPNVAASAITPVNAFGETRYGVNINLVEGFEVVLPTGEITRVGSMAYADTEFGPYYRYITGPDLVGLFTRSNGAFGIVTKVAYRCLRRPRLWSFHSYYWPMENIRDLTGALMESTAVETFGVHLMDRWCWVKINELELPHDCQFFLLFLLDAQNETEMKGKEQTMREICETHRGILFPGSPKTSTPDGLPFLLHGDGPSTEKESSAKDAPSLHVSHGRAGLPHIMAPRGLYDYKGAPREVRNGWSRTADGLLRFPHQRTNALCPQLGALRRQRPGAHGALLRVQGRIQGMVREERRDVPDENSSASRPTTHGRIRWAHSISSGPSSPFSTPTIS